MGITKWIGKIADKNKTIARIVEISFYGAILAWLQFVWDALITSDFSNYKVAIGMVITGFVAWVVSGLQQYFRDKKEILESK